MNTRLTPHGRTEWDLWALVVKIVVPIISLGILYFFAHKGDTVALVTLVVLGTAMLIGLGVFTTLTILDRAEAREDTRFRANVKENLAIADQVSRLQNRQMTGLTNQNRHLLRQTGEMDRLAGGQRAAGGLDIDALFGEWEIEAPEVEALDDSRDGNAYLHDST